MNYNSKSPWLTYLFLAAIFFLVYHDVSISKKGTDNFNPTENEIVTDVSEGSVVRRVGLLSLGLFAIVSMILQSPNSRLRIRGSLGWVFLGFVGWAFLSLIWAEDPALSIRRLVAFGIFCIAAAAIARRFSVREVVQWTFFVTALFLVVGILAELFLGTFRPFAADYRFAGTIAPNDQGVNCALLMLSGAAAANIEKRRRTIFRACALVGLVFLILTASRTSFAAAVLALSAYLASVCSRRVKIAMAYAFSIALCVLLLLMGNTVIPGVKSAILLGRGDAGVDSFNGRAGIWDDVNLYIERRPILGYGYGGFWTPVRISEISYEEKWGVPNSHSAYLDYLLTLGAVGLVAYLLLLFAGIRSAFRSYDLSQNSAFAYCGAFLVFCALDGMLESAVINPSPLMFLSLVVYSSLAFKDSSRALGKSRST